MIKSPVNLEYVLSTVLVLMYQNMAMERTYPSLSIHRQGTRNHKLLRPNPPSLQNHFSTLLESTTLSNKLLPSSGFIIPQQFQTRFQTLSSIIPRLSNKQMILQHLVGHERRKVGRILLIREPQELVFTPATSSSSPRIRVGV